MANPGALVILDSSDPLNLIINTGMDNDDENASPPDWSQLGALWSDENSKQSQFIDSEPNAGLLDFDMDMPSLTGSLVSGIEPSALHMGLSEPPVGFSSFDDPFAFPASASPADILAAQFHLASQNSDSPTDSHSPIAESIPSPGYTSDSTQNSSELSIPASSSSDFSGNPAAELAHRVRQSAGVMLAVPMDGSGAPFQSSQLFPMVTALQTKLPIPRLQRSSTTGPPTPPNFYTPSATSSAASTPPPSTPPPSTSIESSPSTTSNNAQILSQLSSVARPKTSHTTIERRYRTNLNARIQSLRMAVPALRVLEDRDSGGSSKKIKKNLRTGVLIRTSTGASPHSITTADGGTALAAYTAGSLNPYGEVDVIDERGYVDGVKVARKCSKANVLGKAVEYIRVLKRREIRLRAEQDGLKSLVCGLVGGPALLREWEKEWKDRFGGEERDEVPLDGSMEGEDEVDYDEDEEDEDDDGEGVGKKRKRVKVEKDVLSLPKKEMKPPPTLAMTVDGQPEKRKRGRPRKIPLPVRPAQVVPPPASSPVVQQQPQSQQSQYLLAVFALFSFFNSSLTSPFNNQTTHHGHGHVLSPVVTQTNSDVGLSVSTVTWRDCVHIMHLAVTVFLLVGVVFRMGSGFTSGRVKKYEVYSGSIEKDDVEKKVEATVLDQDVVLPFISALTLYRSLPPSTSTIIRALFLYRLASSTRVPLLLKPLLRLRAKLLWSSSRTRVQDNIITSFTPEEVFNITLPTIGVVSKDTGLVEAIAESLIKRRLSDVLGKWFVREVTCIRETETTADDISEDMDFLLETAKEFGGELLTLAKNVERIRSSRFEVQTMWKAVDSRYTTIEEEEENDELDGSSPGLSVDSFDESEEDAEEEVPSVILRALVLYRSLFLAGSSKSVLPSISIEPPTPITPTPARHRISATMNTMPPALSATTSSLTEQSKKIYALRTLLGNRVFEKQGDMMEDARDRVVDMLVDAERTFARTRV